MTVNLILLIIVIVETVLLAWAAFRLLRERPDGVIEVEATSDDGGKRFSLNLNSSPYDLDKKKRVVFEVQNLG